MDPISMELEVIQSIFDTYVDVCDKTRVVVYRFEDNTNVSLTVRLPVLYPEGVVEVDVDFKSEHKNYDSTVVTALTDDQLHQIKTDLNNFTQAHSGENILFDLINTFKVLVSNHLDNVKPPNQSVTSNASAVQEVKQTRNSDNKITDFFTSSNKKEPIQSAPSTDIHLCIIHGEKYTTKKSTFQAHYARIEHSNDVAIFKQQLMTDKRIASATHNIMVYKIKNPVNGNIECDFDDDGETGAGRKLLTLITKIKSLDNIVIIVTRWFGGVLLGPSRFRIINDVAIELLRSKRLIP